MAKPSPLPYDPPFRYLRPSQDLQAIFGAQTGNPPLVTVKAAKAQKPSSLKKKSPKVAARPTTKAGKAKLSKPAPSRRAGSAKAK